MRYNDSGQGDIIGIIVGAVVAIFIVIVGFFFVLPEIAKVTGSSVFSIYALGVILLLAIIASVVLALLALFRR